MLLVTTATTVGLDRAMSAALEPWRPPLAVHDPGKVLLDLAIAVAIGGDCLADIGQVRSMPAVFGPVASDPTVSRLIDRLAVDVDRAERAINAARAQTRRMVWNLAGTDAPDHDITPKQPIAVDTDATLLTAHSEKELAAATYKRGFGFHPLCVFVDHGPQAPGSRSRCCSVRATRARTPPPTISRSSQMRCGSYHLMRRVGLVGRC